MKVVDCREICKSLPKDVRETLESVYGKPCEEICSSEGINLSVSFEQNETIPTFIDNIDKLLEGGIKSGWTYEVSGEYATGKTQFVLQVTTSFLLHDKRVAFVSTEGTFPLKRIEEIGERLKVEHGLGDVKEKLDNLFIVDRRTVNFVQLFNILQQVLNERFDLLVIDSISEPFRRTPQFQGLKGLSQRRKILNVLLDYLNKIAEKGTSVIVTNQVYSSFKFTKRNNKYYLVENEVEAYGGNLFYHWASVRLMFKKIWYNRPERKFVVLDAPNVSNETGMFVICRGGLYSLPIEGKTKLEGQLLRKCLRSVSLLR